MKSPHVAIVSRYARKGDGQGRANREIALRALHQGLPVTLLADEIDPLLTLRGAEWIPVRPRFRGNDLAYGIESILRATRSLRKLDRRPDIVHAYGWTMEGEHDINTAQFVHSAWRRHPMHPSRTNRGAYGTYQWLFSALNAWGERRSFERARKVVGASTTIRSELTRWAGVPEDRIEVVLNGVDSEQFRPGPTDRVALGLPSDVPLALFVGDIRTGRKNLDTVLKAVALRPEIHLAVVGTVEGSPWPALAERLEIADRVVFLDFRTDIAELMRAADCFVFPSRYEACALVLLEALASGLPVITAKTTGGAEAVVDGSGIQVEDAEDATEIADALGHVLLNPEVRSAMAAMARSVGLRHSWESVGDQYISRYRALMR